LYCDQIARSKPAIVNPRTCCGSSR
jgi:hypothetical protein